MNTERSSRRMVTQKLFLSRSYVVAALIIFSISPSPFLGFGNINLVLLGFMMFSFFLMWTANVSISQLYLYLFVGSILVFPPIFNPESFRWSTILYSSMFCFSFVAYENMLRRSKIRIEQFEKAIRILLLCYFFMLLVQQLCVLAGLPVLFASQYSVATPWKLNSLSAEPSWAARAIGVLMFAYVTLHEIRTGRKYSFFLHFKKDIYVWLGVLWSLSTMQSATAVLFLVIIFLRALDGKNVAFAILLIIVTTASGLASAPDQLSRVLSIISALATFDYTELTLADKSGSIRIAPLMILAQRSEILSVQGLFGHGIDSVSAFLSTFIRGLPENFKAGGMMLIWYEYGFISFLLFIVFSIRVAKAWESFPKFIFWFLIVFLAGVNTQYVWSFLLLSTTLEYFRRRTKHSEMNSEISLTPQVATSVAGKE